MKKSKIINEGGIQGAGTGFLDTKSSDWQAFLSVIEQHSENRTREERTDTKLKEIRFRMGAYLRNMESKQPVDVQSFLNEAISAVGVKKKDFAAYIGIEDSNLSAMLNGNRRISPEFALKLEQIFSVNATLWLSVQAKNDLEKLRQASISRSLSLSIRDLVAKAEKATLSTTNKSQKHEPARKTTGK